MKKKIILLALLVLVTVACRSEPDLETPPEIRYGEDTCSRCLMIINEARYAASYVTGSGEVRRFDDIGEMFAYVSESPEQVVMFWVHDYDTEAWIKGKEAFYVAAGGFRTPMGFDIVAVSTRERADSLAAEMDGATHTFGSLMEMAVSGDSGLAHEPGEL